MDEIGYSIAPIIAFMVGIAMPVTVWVLLEPIVDLILGLWEE